MCCVYVYCFLTEHVGCVQVLLFLTALYVLCVRTLFPNKPGWLCVCLLLLKCAWVPCKTASKGLPGLDEFLHLKCVVDMYKGATPN